MSQRSTKSFEWKKCIGAMLLVAAVAMPSAVSAQKAHLVSDGRLSLAWWQLNPHMGHLWASTCPGDPGWRPGEGVTPAGAAALVKSMRGRYGYGTNTIDSIIPLYPRRAARPLCNDQGVDAEISVDDMRTLHGAHGTINVRPAALYTGMRLRDVFTVELLQASTYPNITFKMDSLTNVQVAGDTTHANAVGTLSLHGVTKPLVVPVKAWKEAGGLRVTGQFQIPAKDMVEVYNLSRAKLGLGIGTGIWKLLHMGVDVVLKDDGSSRS